MVKRVVTGEELARPLIPYEEAVNTVLAAFTPLQPQRVPLASALGLIAAEAVVASINVPGFANSAMDGYAIRSQDVAAAQVGNPVRLRISGDLPAGAAPDSAVVREGTAATIMTGAPIPDGADAVAPWEDTTRVSETEIDVNRSFDPGRNVRPAGEDVQAGTQVVSVGDRLSPVHLAVIASVGAADVVAHPRPRVAVLSTGDELVPPGGTLRPGQLFESNTMLIAAMAEAAGARIVDDALLADDPEIIADWLAQAAESADLIVTSGGASVGEHDWIRAILEKEGELSLWRVAIKPGKPIAFGTVRGTPVLALPGNPGSAFVGLHAFVQPVLRRLGGHAHPRPLPVTARLAAAVNGSPARTQFTRVRLDGGMAIPLPTQSSVVLSNLLPADAFAIVPPGGLPEGAEVLVELL